MEGHGREEILDGVDVSRTIGWFTTQFPVTLSLPAAEGWGEVLKSVKEQVRAVPHRGLSYEALRYLSPPGSAPGACGRTASVRASSTRRCSPRRSATTPTPAAGTKYRQVCYNPPYGPKYFVLLGWSADKVATIRDFRHAGYVVDGLEYRRGLA